MSFAKVSDYLTFLRFTVKQYEILSHYFFLQVSNYF